MKLNFKKNQNLNTKEFDQKSKIKFKNKIIDSYLGIFFKRLGRKLLVLITGTIKEFFRITWLRGKALWESLLVVLVILTILAVIFYIVSLLAGLI